MRGHVLDARAAFAVIAFSFGALASCDSADVGYCGRGGELVVADDATRYCVYRGQSPSAGEQLRCPSGLTFKLQIATVVVCTERQVEVGELPPEVCARATIAGCGEVADAGSLPDAGRPDGPDARAVEDMGPIDSSAADGGDSDAPRDAASDAATDAATDAGLPAVLDCGGRRICQVVAGGEHSCALLATGRVKCWGRGSEGQIGRAELMVTNRTPEDVAGLENVAELTAGQAHTCARHLDGSVSCWGRNDLGQLGRGTSDRTPHAMPVAIPALASVEQIDSSREHTCARSADGIRCWGAGADSRLGDGSTEDRPSPVLVGAGGLPAARWVGAGYLHTCAVAADGTGYCWGRNEWGALGNDMEFMDGSSTPARAMVLAGAATVAADVHSCALVAEPTAAPWCWGDNVFGQCGQGSTSGYFDVPAPVALGPEVPVQLDVGEARSCVVVESGGVLCWGAAPRGDGVTGSSGTPARVVGVEDATQVSLGRGHACVLRRSDLDPVLCWGMNNYGQLGTGPDDLVGHDTVVPVEGL